MMLLLCTKKTTYTNTNTLLITGKEFVLKIDADKCVCSCPTNRTQHKNHNIKTVNKCFENETKCKHLGVILTTGK